MSLAGTLIAEPGLTRGRLPRVSQDAVLPPDYWRPGREVPTGARQRRWYQYQALYEGDQTLVADEARYLAYAPRNFFASIADFYRDFLMTSPPTMAGTDASVHPAPGTDAAGAAAPAPPAHPLEAMLHDALRPALVDHIVHGVSILGVSPGDIVRVDPRYCYPLDRPVADDGALAAAVLVPRADRTLAVIQDGTETIHRLDHASSEDWSYPSGVLGQPVRRTAVPPRRYYTVPLAPADGAFGASMVRALLPPVAQYTTLMSSYQSQIVACANILVAEPAETGSIRVDVDAAEAGTTRPLQVAQLLGRAVEGYADLRFVGGEVGEQAYLEALTRIEREIHDISAVSPTLAGWLTDGGMAIGSGVAFSRSFVRTSARLGEIIAAFLPVLEAALAAAGQPAELEWINPLERLDQQALERTAHMTAAMGRQGGTDDAGPEADDE